MLSVPGVFNFQLVLSDNEIWFEIGLFVGLYILCLKGRLPANSSKALLSLKENSMAGLILLRHSKEYMIMLEKTAQNDLESVSVER